MRSTAFGMMMTPVVIGVSGYVGELTTTNVRRGPLGECRPDTETN